MRTRRVGVLVAILFCVGILVGNLFQSVASGAGFCGWVGVDCSTSKIPPSLIPPTVVVLPNTTKTLVDTATNTITTTDLCTTAAAAGICPITGTNSKLNTAIIPDLSSTYILNTARGAPGGVATLNGSSQVSQPTAIAASKYLTPANPTSLTSTSYLMFGLGSTLTYTTLRAGNTRITFSWFPVGVGPATNNYRLAYGTGLAPANGTAATGTVVGATYIGGTAVAPVPIDGGVSPTPTMIVREVIVHLTTGTAYWIDMQGAKGSGNTSVGMSTLEVTIQELDL
jgi:hypothetical protein